MRRLREIEGPEIEVLGINLPWLVALQVLEI
jgi:hypothetical protein